MDSLWLLVTLCVLCSLSTAEQDAIPRSSQVHIALIPPDKMSISWVTKLPYSEPPSISLSSKPPNSLNVSEWSQIIGYTQPDTDINRYYHHVITPALTPHQRYWHKPGGNASIYSFTARDPTGTKSDSEKSNGSNQITRILAYGDLGVMNSKETIERIKNITNTTASNTASTAVDFILHFGDIAYPDDYDGMLIPEILIFVRLRVLEWSMRSNQDTSS